MPSETEFSKLNLKPELLGNLADLRYTHMTLVQAKTLPLLIDGFDVLARAKTGSGKTAAFGLGLLNNLQATSFNTQALVLCPTRELADQVAKEIRRLARAIPNIKILGICGGTPLRAQRLSLQRSPHIIVGTPGRIHRHLRGGNINLSHLQTLVLDEADRMLDMGFEDELDAILTFVPKERQTLLFSATYPDAIASISAKVQRKPKTIDVTDDEQPALIGQIWCAVTRENRHAEFVRVLKAWGGSSNLAFCNTRIECAELELYLRAQGIAAVALHGGLDQTQRNQVLVRFSNRSASVLIATDVAARGLDVKDIDAVFNVELPRQPDVYIHRIGRTGRAGKQGIAVSLVETREMWRLEDIGRAQPGAVMQQRDIPYAKRGGADLLPRMSTIQISGGKKNKLRPGDLLGALTAVGGITGNAVGNIDLFDTYAYVAVASEHVNKALRQLTTRPIKGRKFRARVRK